MDCPNEFTWAMYADGELPESETWTLRRHLAECSACRQLAASLQEENRALVHAFQHLDMPVLQAARAGQSAGKSRILELGAIVFGMALAVRLSFDYLTGQQAPVSLKWLSPLNPEGQLNFLLTSIVYLFDEGGP